MNESIDVTLLQEIVESAMAGREGRFVCPMCGEETLETAEIDEFHVRLECRRCNKYIDVPLTP